LPVDENFAPTPNVSNLAGPPYGSAFFLCANVNISTKLGVVIHSTKDETVE
jgi:hypothetical protein